MFTEAHTELCITGKNLPDKVTTDLKTLIHQISKVCLQAIKPETPYVMDVISKDYAQATTTDWELDKSHWINVIAHLRLTEQQVITLLHASRLLCNARLDSCIRCHSITPTPIVTFWAHFIYINCIIMRRFWQVQTILRSRMAHVEKMVSIYQERAGFAKQAAELAMMSATTGQARVGYEDHSMMGVLLRHGYLYCARYMVTVHRITELIRVSVGLFCGWLHTYLSNPARLPQIVVPHANNITHAGLCYAFMVCRTAFKRSKKQ